MTIRSIIADNNGHLILLLADGTLKRQRRLENTVSGDYATEWIDVPLDEVEGRVLHVATRLDGKLIVATHDGRLWEQHSGFYDRAGVYRWRELAGRGPACG